MFIRVILVAIAIANILFKLNYIISEASHDAGAQSVTVKATACEFDPDSRKLNIYLNLYFRVKAKRGVKFRYSTRNASRNRRKMGDGVS